MRILCLLCVIALCGCGGGGGGNPVGVGNLVQNGDFETPSVVVNATLHGPTQIPGWQIEADGIDIAESYWQPAHGSQSIDLNGLDRGGVYQDLSTAAGHVYHLRFAMAGNPDPSPAVKVMNVYWGAQLVDTLSFDTTGHTSTSMGWGYHDYNVTGTGTDRLRFVSESPTGGRGPALDDVSVTP